MNTAPAEGRKNLGITAKSAAGPEINELAHSGIVLRPEKWPKVADLAEYRRRDEGRQRWRLQRGAQGLLRGQRVELCQRAITGGSVGVARGDGGGGAAHFTGVITCGSVWHCPVCAAQITEERRRELQRAMAAWIGQGGAVYLMTNTFRHDLSLELDAGLDAMQTAHRKMKGSRAFKALMQRAGALGSIKALEVTYGENGWHPHTHTLIFARPGMLDVLAEIRPLWAAAVKKAGLGEVNEHGFDIRGGDFAADYVAKFGKEPGDQTRQAARAWWSASHELTKGHQKQGQRMKGATPFTLLRWFIEGDAEAGALFARYAEAFKGRRQLFYSPGLKEALDLFGLEQSEPPRAPAVELFRIDPEGWSAVLRHNARWEILYVTEKYGPLAAQELIETMRRSRGRYRGAFKRADPFGSGLYDFDWLEAA